MDYIKLEDLIEWAYFTWCFNFKDVEQDLREILELIEKDGITHIGLANGKVIYLNEWDKNDLAEYLSDKVKDIVQAIEDYNNEW